MAHNSDTQTQGGLSDTGFFDWAAILDAVLRADTEGQFTAAEARFEALRRSVDEIVNAGLPPQERANATAQLMRDSGFSARAISQVSGLPFAEIENELRVRGFDVSGNQISTATIGDATGAATGPSLADLNQAATSTTAINVNAGLDNVFDPNILTDGTKTDAQINQDIQNIINQGGGETVVNEKIGEYAKNNNINDTDIQRSTGSNTAGLIAAAVAGGLVTAAATAGTTTTPTTTPATTGTTTGTTTTGTTDGGFLIPLLGLLGSIGSTVLQSQAAQDAANAQSEAAQRALDIFEKNAGIATAKLETTTGEAISTLEAGEAAARGDITGGTQAAIEAQRTGAVTGRADIIAGRDQARTDLIEAFGLQQDEINTAAAASSGFISEARETAVSAINRGFGEGISSVKSARDLANGIIQSSTTVAEEKLDLARAGAVAAQDRGLSAVRSDFQPFLDAGQVTIEGLERLVNDPETQRQFLLDNPFFDEIANQTERRLLANQAARGRVGTGGTQLELRNRLLEAGNQLLNTAINQRLAVVGVGQQAAGSIATAELNRANAVSAIEQTIGTSLADLVEQAGVNRANIQTQAGRDIANLQATEGERVAGVETGAARDLATIETTRGGDVSAAIAENARQIAAGERVAGGQLADIATTTGINEANILGAEGVNLANIATGAAAGTSTLQAAEGVNVANILTGEAANIADVTQTQGESVAAGIIGKTNAITSGITDLTNLVGVI